MALSIGRLGGASSTAYVAMQPQNYSLNNQSAVSAAYEESLMQVSGMGAGDAIDSTPPVQYPNAQLTENRIAQIRGAQQAEKGYHSIAAAFEGYTASYNANLQGTTYNTTGAGIDVFA